MMPTFTAAVIVALCTSLCQHCQLQISRACLLSTVFSLSPEYFQLLRGSAQLIFSGSKHFVQLCQ